MNHEQKKPANGQAAGEATKKSKLIEGIIAHFDKIGGTKSERDGWTVLCPFHADKNPSLKVFRDGGFFCRSCGARGTHLQLAREIGLPGLSVGAGPSWSQQMREYIQRRLQAEPEKLEKFGVHPLSSGMRFEVSGAGGEATFGKHDPHAGQRYLLPRGQIKGKLFGLSHLPTAHQGRVFVTEGVFDALTFLAAGLPAVAILGNANAPVDVFHALTAVGVSHAVFAFDGDPAGWNFTQSFIEYFSARKEIFSQAIVLQRGDINDAFQDGTLTEVMRVVDPLMAWANTARVTTNAAGEAIRFVDAVRSPDAGSRHLALTRAFAFFKRLNPLQVVNVEAFKAFADVSEAEWQELFREYEVARDRTRLQAEMNIAAVELTSGIAKDPLEAFEAFKQRGEKLVAATQPKGSPWIGANLSRIVDKIRNASDGVELIRGLPEAKAYEGDLVIIAGPSGWGKSTLAIDVANTLSLRGGVFYASYELPEQMLLSKFIASGDRVSYTEIKRTIREGGEPYIPENVLRNIAIIDSSPSIEALARYVSSFGPEVSALIVDYDQLAPVERDTANEERRVAEISGVCKRLALEKNIIVILLSQLTKKGNGEKQTWDLRYSAQKENDASLVIRIEPEDFENEAPTRNVKLHLTKNRHGAPSRALPFAIDFLKCTVERRDGSSETGWATK